MFQDISARRKINNKNRLTLNFFDFDFSYSQIPFLQEEQRTRESLTGLRASCITLVSPSSLPSYTYQTNKTLFRTLSRTERCVSCEDEREFGDTFVQARLTRIQTDSASSTY